MPISKKILMAVGAVVASVATIVADTPGDSGCMQGILCAYRKEAIAQHFVAKKFIEKSWCWIAFNHCFHNLYVVFSLMKFGNR